MLVLMSRAYRRGSLFRFIVVIMKNAMRGHGIGKTNHGHGCAPVHGVREVKTALALEQRDALQIPLIG